MRNEPQRPKPIPCWDSRDHPNLQILSVCKKIFVGYSGGIDSHVLLHLCATDEQLKPKITAVYINHGLQKEAEVWGKHCQSVCDGLGVEFLSMAVNAAAEPGQSPEEAARNARYAALKPFLEKDDVLMLAQHSEDQLETVLLQLFRGSGLKGLSGMPEVIAFGQGKLVRPLLQVSKADIIDYAAHHGLQWIEDPSNQKSDFDRNFLRNDIIPLLKQRWPSLDKTVSRAAKHCADSQILVDSVADGLFEAVFDSTDYTLSLDALSPFSELEQQLVIRQWFRQLGLKMPGQRVMQRILQDVITARADADPVLSTQGRQVRRYRNKLYCIHPIDCLAGDNLHWPVSELLLTLFNGTVYAVVDSASGIPTKRWLSSVVTVKFRSGGEMIRLPGRKGRHSLKNLFQEAGIPTWERAYVPLVYLDGHLAAVGEYWISDDYYSEGQEPCFRIVRRKINPKANDD